MVCSWSCPNWTRPQGDGGAATPVGSLAVSLVLNSFTYFENSYLLQCYNPGNRVGNVSFCTVGDVAACCKEIYLFVSGPADFTQFILVGAVLLPLRRKGLLHMDVRWQERGLRSHSLLLSRPLRQPSDSGLPVATPLSSSCRRGSLGSSYTVKLLPQLAPRSRPLSCGLLRSDFKLPKLYMYCTLLQRMQVVPFPFLTQAL